MDISSEDYREFLERIDRDLGARVIRPGEPGTINQSKISSGTDLQRVKGVNDETI